MESLARAARQVALYGAEHPITASAIEAACLELAAAPGEDSLELRADSERLTWNEAPLTTGNTHVLRLHSTMRERLIAAIGFRSRVRAADLMNLLSLLAQEARSVISEGGATKIFAATNPTTIRVEDIDFARQIRESEVAWLDSCEQIEPEAAEPLRDIVQYCLRTEKWSQDSTLSGTLPIRSDPGWGEDRPLTESLAEALARLVQRAGETAGLDDENARNAWRADIASRLNSLAAKWRAAVFRSHAGASPGYPDMLTLVAREMTPEECVPLVLDYSGAISTERSGGLTMVLRRIMSDSDKASAIEPLLHQAALSAGISEEVYQNVVGVLMVDLRTPESGIPVPPAPPEPGREPEPIAQPEEDLSDLLETTTPEAVGGARGAMLLESLESDLTVNQYGSVLHLLIEALEERRTLADSNLLLEALAAIAREAGQGRDKARRTMAASALARSISADTVAYLSAEMAGASTAKQSEILALLGWLGRRGMAALCALAQDVDPVRAEKATHVIVERDAPDFLNLRYLLSQASADEMERIISVIIAGAEPAALAQLGALTDHPRVRTRLDLVRLIHQSQRPELLNILMSLLGDPSAEVRLGAVNALAERVTSTNISALCDRADTEAAFGEAGRVKEAAVKALGRMRVPEAVPILSHLLSSPGLLGLLRTPRLRVAAAHALAQIGTAEARQALENGAQDRQRAVRDACRTALMRLDVTSSGARHPGEAPNVF